MGIHAKIAENVCRGEEYQIRCPKCGAGRYISQEEFAEFLAHGWPKHCEQTMSLIEGDYSK